MSGDVLGKDVMAQRDVLPAVTASVLTVGSSPKNEIPPESEKGSDAGDGNRFQLKLLMLFCIRAINEGYKFYLGTELVDQCNNFYDLIFKYTQDKKVDKTGDNWPYQYLQAKSRQKGKVEKITTKDLFSPKQDSDFSLPKYFRSFREITRRGDKIDSCIICTNIGFANKENLQENGIEVKEVQLTDPILKFKKLSDDKIPKHYKIEIKEKDLLDIFREESDSKRLAKLLCGNKRLNSKCKFTRNYHMALVNENVIDLVTKKFQDDFIKGSDGLSEGAKELRQNLLRFNINIEHIKSFTFSFDKHFGKKPLQPEIFNYPLPLADKEIYDFLDKLIFAVNTPNEEELDDVLKNEVSNYFTLVTTDLQSDYVMNEMVNWFKREDNVWLSSEEAKTLFLDKTQTLMESIRVNEISIDYQKQLKKDLMELEFNTEAIQVMTEKLRPLLLESNSSSVIIGTESPQHTAVKLVAAIKTFPEFKCDDSFLVTSSKRLEDEDQMEKFKGCLELKKDSHILLVIVCDGKGSAQHYKKYATLLPERRKNNKVVIICLDKTASMTDEIKYTELTDEFKQKILSLEVSFQLKKGVSQQELENNRITVGELIGDKPEEVIDSNSIKELTKTGREIKIPSFDDTTHLEELMYSKRQLKCQFRHDKFEDELVNSLNWSLEGFRSTCTISQDGHVEWLVEDDEDQYEYEYEEDEDEDEDEDEKELFWEKIKNVAHQSPSLSVIHECNYLIPHEGDGKEKSIVIISGVAGSGKSTLLSHYYKEIKKTNPDHWIIRINLVNHYEAILQLNNFTYLDIFDFLVNQLHIVDGRSSFSRSLLRNRLAKGDRIVVMFDGFDEVNDECQQKTIQLIKAFTKEKLIQLYVTTRPHMLDKLQCELSQLSFSLENFTEKDQIDYLVSYWKKELNLSADHNGSLQQFAQFLVQRESEIVKEKNKSYIGVPLQCRILAECFQSELQAIMKQNNKDKKEQIEFENQMLANFNFDLNSFYKLLMKTKRQVFREQKAYSSNQNEIVVDAVNRLIQDIESHLTKLAIETLVTDKKSVDILWPPQFSYRQWKTEKIHKEKRNNELGVQFGLITFKDDGKKASKMEFCHRTFAEYLLAKYLYEGIAIYHCEDNQLLDNKSVRDLIVNQILVEDYYDGVRLFIDSMLKETITSKKWLRVISEGKEALPVPLQNLTIDLALPIRKEKTSLNALSVAAYKGNENIFYFLCDCLDVVLENVEVRQVFGSAFNIFTLTNFYFVSSGLFQRFIKYHDEADWGGYSLLTHIMLNEMTSTKRELTSEFHLRKWNRKGTKEIVKILLDFLEKQKTIYMNKVLSRDLQLKIDEIRIRMEEMFHFFTFNEYYDSLFGQFFRLLSSLCSNDHDFLKLMTYTLTMRNANGGAIGLNYWEYPANTGIQKTLTHLRDLGRNKVMEGLSHLALVSDKKVFEQFYQPCRPNKDDYSKLQLLLRERDSSGMTLLHRAAYFGDAEMVDSILDKDYFNSTTDNPIVNDIKLALTDDERFSPFYVAAASGHKEICHKILSFLKKFNLINITSRKDKFLRKAMSDALQYKNVPMFQVILETVNQVLGQDYLLSLLLKSDDHSFLRPIHYTFHRLATFDKDIFKFIESIFLQNGGDKGYQGLYYFVMNIDSTFGIPAWQDGDFRMAKIRKILENVEDKTFHGMLTAIGLKKLTKLYLDEFMLGITRGFRFLSDHFLPRFTRHQRSQFVDTITSLDISDFSILWDKMSYWGEWFIWPKDFIAEDYDCIDNLLKSIADNQPGRTGDIQKLVFNDNGKDITRALLNQNSKLFSMMSKYLSKTDQLKANNHVRKNGPEIIDELTKYIYSEDYKFRRQVLRYWVNILPFYEDKKGQQHFEKLVGTLLLLRTSKIGKSKEFYDYDCTGQYVLTKGIIKVQYSFWSKYLDSYDDDDGNKVEMVDKFLKIVSEKLGKEYVKEVVLHKDCMGIVLLGAELQEDKQLVNVMLSHLSDRDRNYVNQLIINNSTFNSRRYKAHMYAEPCQCINMPMNICYCWCC